jgi:hypothetical protein
VGGEHISQLPGRLNALGFPKIVAAPALSRASQKATILVSLAEIAVAFLNRSVYTSDP